MTEFVWHKGRDAVPSGTFLVAETQATLISWQADKPRIAIACIGGTTFARVGDFTRRVAWPIAGDVDIELAVDVDVRASLASAAASIARASLLIVEEPLPPRARHVLKLAAVAGIRSVAVVARDDEEELRARRFVSTWGDAPPARLNGDDAIVLRPAPAFDVDDGHRLDDALVAALPKLVPRSIPDGPLLDRLALAPTLSSTSSSPAPRALPLFTGRCVVDERSWTSSKTEIAFAAGVRVLPSPTGLVAFLDEKNDLVVVRKVKQAPEAKR